MKAIETLGIEAKNEKLAHAYLFIGGSNEENQEVLNFFVETKKCLKEDISEIKSTEEIGKAGEIKVESVRELIHSINLSPNGESKIAVLRGCERLNLSSGNILLKQLEEPPSYLTFLLFASKPSVLQTISSRCRVIYLNATKKEKSLLAVDNFYKQNFFEASREIDEIIDDGQVDEHLDSTTDWLREKLLQTLNPAISEILKELEFDKKSIERNSNPKLVLECLYLRIRKIL